MRKYYGKEKCRILKQVRAEIAKNNDIDWIIEECPHKGDCLGTCPKCEAEVRELEKKLEERRRLGLNVALAGVAAGIALTVSGCAPQPAALQGDVPAAGGNNGQTTSDQATEAPQSTEGETGTLELEGEILDDGSALTIDGDHVIMGGMTVEEVLMGEPMPEWPEELSGKSTEETETEPETPEVKEPEEPALMGKIAAPYDEDLE